MMSTPVIGCGIEKILVKVLSSLLEESLREAGYLFKFHKNVADLKDNLNNLKAALIEVQKAVEIDRDNARVINRDIFKWLKDVRKMMEDLEAFLEVKIQNKAHGAGNNARDIDPDISKWLDGAGKMMEGLEALLEDKIQDKAHGVCFKVSCPNCYWRFKLGKKASKTSADVVKLIKGGEPFKKGADEIVHYESLKESRTLPTAVPCEKFDSRTKVFDDILTALRDDNVTRVGIYGMPGVGKTTIMEQVRNAMVEKKEFEEIAFAVVSATWDVKSIQGRLASDLRLYDLAIEDHESERADLLRRRLMNGKKILVILDDVWDKLPLEDMGLDFGDSRGCKILMTSRIGWVCEANKCLPFLIHVLSNEEAWGFFRQHAGNCIEDAGINPVAMAVLNECGGLPLIIRAVGEALKDGELCEWKAALQQFKNFTPRNIVNLDEQVYKTLELSFSKLNPEEAKSCVLLCSLFPEDADISIDDLSLLAMAMGFLRSMDSIEDARNRVLSLVKALKTSCLLLGCEDGDKVKLHDVIRDVAINIASEDVKYRFMVKSPISAWPAMDEACRAISLRIQDIPELPRKLECPQLETLMLNCSCDSGTKIPGTFLDGLENLTVLILVNVTISSLPILPNLLMLRIQESLWRSEGDAYTFDISTLKKLKKLEMLILVCSSIRKLPLDLRELKNLRLLDMRYCPKLEFIEEGVLSSLTHLEELYLPMSFARWNAALLDELNSLTRLTALETRAINFGNLPYYRLCKKLIRYAISVGFDFSEQTSSTRTITMSDIDLVDRKDAVKVLVEGAEKLFLVVNKSLKNLFYESSRDGFQNLKYLEVRDCEGMEYLLKWTPPLFQKRSFSKLEVLVVYACKITYLVSLPMVNELEHLRHLKIEECNFIEAVVVENESKGEGEESLDPVRFQSLKFMELKYLPELTSFYYEATKRSGMFPTHHAQILFPGKVAFPVLERITLDSLPKIEAIWDNQCPIEESFSQLRDLTVWFCGRLKTIVPFVMLPRLKILQEIRVFGCESVETEFAWPTGVELFPIEITTLLPELKEMTLKILPELKQTVLSSKELNDDIVVSPKLTTLCIDNCDKLKNVLSFSAAKNLKHLEQLIVEYCEGMEEIVVPIRKGREESDGEIFFPQLKYIKLDNMKKLTKFWGCEYEEHHEEEIQEADPVLTNQPLPFHSNKVFFPNLEELQLCGVGISPLDIGHRAESFCKLRCVTIVECEASTLVLPNWLHNLQELCVKSCDEARELFDLQGLNAREQHVRLLSRMSMLKIDGLPKLQSLWNGDPRGILDIRSLTEIKIEDCGLLKMLFSCSVARALEQLWQLTVACCPLLETIVYDDEGKEGTGDDIEFPRLKFLYLEKLPMLSSFCNAKVALTMSSLKAARLRKCPQMLRFSSGGLHLPKMNILSSPARSSHVADLKEHLQASAMKINDSDFDDKELATDGASHGEGLAIDEDSDGEMYFSLVEGLTLDGEDEIEETGILGYGNYRSAPRWSKLLF